MLASSRNRSHFLRIDYLDLNSAGLNCQLREEVDADHPLADVAWSSAMDRQVKLVNDGYAQRYASPVQRGLPDWAKWRDETYGTTFEPVVFARGCQAIAEH
ncbi:hypothetical protein QU481_22240 [Crenobacter sp. SG2303]|uniref:Uncharacterized protein n=1 Tax=Crenobacter oryzisoli TaxID=3056844 RepID=A0ABT7XVI6_9NEIS|nr:hypothetical protein [Crenobacter sp. SG2303]MDN0077544.1 hypothetical protein [Crenobacter sp. SG2303]